MTEYIEELREASRRIRSGGPVDSEGVAEALSEYAELLESLERAEPALDQLVGIARIIEKSPGSRVTLIINKI